MNGSPSRPGGFVLVHGGTHTAACWSRVIGRLRRPAVAINLPGRGNRPGRLSDLRLQDFVDALVTDACDVDFDDLVLVGHSMAGLILAEAAARLDGRVRHLVYLSAAIPAPGRAAVDMALPPLRPYLRRRLASAAADPDGALDLPRPVARVLFGNGLAASERREMLAGLVPDAPRFMLDPVVKQAPAGIPSTYLAPTRDRIFSRSAQRRMAALAGAEFVPTPGAHDFLFSHPDVIAAELERIAGRALS